MLPFPLVIAAIKPFPLILSPNTTNVGGVADTPFPSYAGILYNSNGTEFKTAFDATLEIYDTSRGNWLDAGRSDRVWIQWVREGGSLTDWNQTDAGDARLNMGAGNYAWCIKRTAAGSNTLIGRFNFYNAAVGGDLLATTGSLTFSNFVDIGGG